MTEQIIFSNKHYEVCIIDNKYCIVNKVTRVNEGDTPVLPQAIAMAEGWSTSITELVNSYLEEQNKDDETSPKVQ